MSHITQRDFQYIIHNRSNYRYSIDIKGYYPFLYKISGVQKDKLKYDELDFEYFNKKGSEISSRIANDVITFLSVEVLRHCYIYESLANGKEYYGHIKTYINNLYSPYCITASIDEVPDFGINQVYIYYFTLFFLFYLFIGRILEDIW